MQSFWQKTAVATAAVALAGGMTVAPVMAETTNNSSGSNVIGIASFKPSNMGDDYNSIIKSVVDMVVIVAALLTFFYLVMGAIKWITSGGDKGKVEEARNQITAAVIGLLILAATWAIFQLVLKIAFGDNGAQMQISTFNNGSSSNNNNNSNDQGSQLGSGNLNG